MSISQERPTNPSKFRLTTKNGSVVYYDKELQENVDVPTPFSFVVLDTLATIKGWSDTDESSFWSNEVRRVGKDTLTIRTSKGMKASGIWRDIKTDPSVAGAKYCSSVYIAIDSRGKKEISNLLLTGAALKAWIEFTQKHNLNNTKVTLSGWSDGKKGSVSYKIPVFEGAPLSEDEKKEAIDLDKELQEYFNGYFNYEPEDHSEVEEVLDEDDKIDLSEIPF